MLTKEKCVDALDTLLTYFDGLYSDYVPAEEILKELINEHFKDVPLNFEELKPGMTVWDNRYKKYICISCVWSEDYIQIKDRKLLITEFEPNRFYRKEIKDVD